MGCLAPSLHVFGAEHFVFPPVLTDTWSSGGNWRRERKVQGRKAAVCHILSLQVCLLSRQRVTEERCQLCSVCPF